MSLLETIRAPGIIGRINPVAKLLAALLLTLPLLLSIDPVSALVALACELVLLIWAGLSPRQLLRRTSPLWVAAPLAAVTTALYGKDDGGVLLALGPIDVTEGSLSLALAVALRILAVGIPGIVLFATTDPTELADGMSQILRLPSRFVLGALAGLRLVGLLADDWRSLALARRARGVADGGRLRRAASQAFALLVLSVRRGTKLATAMEARGFGSSTPRSWARPSVLRMPEYVLMAIAALVAAASITTAVLVGSWRFLAGG